MKTFNLTCEAVETMLHEYLDETLEPWVRISIEEHLGECAHCTALARELRNILREGAALPALLPDRDVWPGIAGRIGAPVIEPEAVAESAPLPQETERIVWASNAFPPTGEETEVASDAAEAPIALPVPALESPVLAMETAEIAIESHAAAIEAAEVAIESRTPVIEPPSPAIAVAEVPIERPEVAIEPPVTIEPTAAAIEPPVVAPEPEVVTSEPLVASEPVATTEAPPIYGELYPPTSAPVALVTESLHPSDTAPAPTIARVPTIAPPHATPVRREKFWTRERMGLAAAALVLLTAGATFLFTSHWLGSTRTVNVASETAAQKLSSNEKTQTVPGARGRVSGRGQVALDSSTPALSSGQLGSALTLSAASAQPLTPSPEQVVYTREINSLQRIVRRQKSELDTSTVTEIDKNLRSIDSAIGQIRAALKKDPGSSLLDGQASRALEMKVELLRRTAMLRSST